MSGHTKEPWVAHGAFYTHGVKGDVFAKDARDVYDATPVCRVVAPVSHRQSKNAAPIDALHATARRKEQAPIIEANARRIVDCVNALTGIENPAAYVKAAQAMAEALADAGDVLELASRPARVDPDRHFSEQVKALGELGGYGALMATASALWREKLGDLAGGEFAAGPCVSTAASRVVRIDEALIAFRQAGGAQS
jgi:hypothetical protein